MRILGLFLLLLNLNSFAENHGNERSNTPLAVKRPIASTANSVTDDFESEYEKAKKDEGGCLWREEDWRRSEKDQDYKHLMDKICRAEKITMELANRDRKRYCPKPLILDQRLAYISRLNAIRLIKEGGMANSNPHSAWYKGLPQKWFKDQFPAAAKVIRFERENMFGYGGGGVKSITAESLASKTATAWIHSPGHHAPMIDCNNRYAGVGIMFDAKRSEWDAYMSFGEKYQTGI